MHHIISHFKSTDPVIHALALKYELPAFTPTTNLFGDICETIIGQQLSVKAADTITKRFKKLFPDEVITPSILLATDDETIRGVGSSYAKIRSMKDFSSRVVDGRLNLEQIVDLPEKEIRRQLLEVKGIGPWTVEMLLMFALGKEDIFSPGDGGLQRAITILYNLDPKTVTPEKLLAISSPWSPYRTYASRLLWKSLDNQ